MNALNTSTTFFRDVDVEAVATFVRNLTDEPGEVREIRALHYADNPDGKWACTVSGYFTDPDKAAAEVARFAKRGTPSAWYCTLNPCKPELLARANNRLLLKAKATTQDDDVETLTRIIFDLDVERPANISTTATELAKAESVTGDVRDYLGAMGWPEPMPTMSGNGGSLIYAVHLPSTDADLTSRLLNCMAHLFDTPENADGPHIKVDTSMFNPSRITKLCGTVAGKGDSIVGVPGMEDRPHRMARVVSVPETWSVVPRERIVELVTMVEDDIRRDAASKVVAPVNPTPRSPKFTERGTGPRFEQFPSTIDGVAGYLRRHNVEIKETYPDKVTLAWCPVVTDCESGNETDIAVLVEPGGKIAYKNQHRRGVGLKWVDVRDKLEPGYREWSEGHKNGTATSAKFSEVKSGTFTPGDEPGNLGGTFDAGEPCANFSEGSIPPAPPFPDTTLDIVTIGELIDANPTLRPPVIDMLAREGDVMNIISEPKIGKSWAVGDLLLSITTGRPWLGRFPTYAGDCLLIDNELHRSDIAHRFPKIARERGILRDEYNGRLNVYSLRGRLIDVHHLRAKLATIERGRFRAIAIDAFYRMLPNGTSETDNAQMTAVYNAVDGLADRLGAVFIIVHHSSKGAQGSKSVVDVGSGAGSIARAADAHVILRQHNEEGAVVMDVRNRSFAPQKPLGLRWSFPCWHVDDALDITDLKMDRGRGGRPRKIKDEIAEAQEKLPVWSPITFAERFITDQPQTEDEIHCESKVASVSGRESRSLLRAGVAKGMVIPWPRPNRNQPQTYANRPPAVCETGNGGGK